MIKQINYRGWHIFLVSSFEADINEFMPIGGKLIDASHAINLTNIRLVLEKNIKSSDSNSLAYYIYWFDNSIPKDIDSFSREYQADDFLSSIVCYYTDSLTCRNCGTKHSALVYDSAKFFSGAPNLSKEMTDFYFSKKVEKKCTECKESFTNLVVKILD